ncbi:hypothetical protein D3C73_1543540 [compost metagenome]
MPVDDHAPQRGTVVLGDEPAFTHLAIGDHREHLARGAVDGQRDIREQIDVDDLPAEQLDGVGAVTCDQHEGRRRIGAELGES